MCPHNKSASIILDNDSVKNRTLAWTNRALLDDHGHPCEPPDLGIYFVKNRTLAWTNRALLDGHGHPSNPPDLCIDLVKNQPHTHPKFSSGGQATQLNHSRLDRQPRLRAS